MNAACTKDCQSLLGILRSYLVQTWIYLSKICKKVFFGLNCFNFKCLEPEVSVSVTVSVTFHMHVTCNCKAPHVICQMPKLILGACNFCFLV